MKIYFGNETAKLKFSELGSSCKRCPFNMYIFLSLSHIDNFRLR